MPAPILVTGSAGFIGFHVVERLPAECRQAVGVDGSTPCCDVSSRETRLAPATPLAAGIRRFDARHRENHGA